MNIKHTTECQTERQRGKKNQKSMKRNRQTYLSLTIRFWMQPRKDLEAFCDLIGRRLSCPKGSPPMKIEEGGREEDPPDDRGVDSTWSSSTRTVSILRENTKLVLF